MRNRRQTTAVLVGAVVLASAGCGGTPDVTPTTVQLTAEPLEQPAALPEAASARGGPSPTPSPSSSPTAQVEAAAPPDAAPTAPTSTEKARFVAAHRPDGAQGLEHVAVDLDADGIDELLFTFVREDHSQVQVAAWSSGRGYRIVAAATGGLAQRIDHVRVGDVNADDVVEIVTMEAHEKGASLTVLAVPRVDRLVGLTGVGGCYDGSATYGVVGAELREVDGDGVPEIVARCDESPLPVNAWSEATYRWSDGAYRVEEKAPPGQDRDGDGADDDGQGGGDDGGRPGRGRGGGDG